MHKCQCCGYMFDDDNMQRISLNMAGKPYNICKSCSDKYKKKGMWDDAKNDINWKLVPCVDEN
ncbi:hypothetical protein U7S25_004168 [Providencia rettgeri]|nr:hypothetical protein [Providencia rettgeri]